MIANGRPQSVGGQTLTTKDCGNCTVHLGGAGRKQAQSGASSQLRHSQAQTGTAKHDQAQAGTQAQLAHYSNDF